MILIHSADIPKPYIQNIDRLFPGLVRIPLPKSKDVYNSISSHPDIFIFAMDYRTIVCAPSLYEYITSSLNTTNFDIIKAKSDPRGNYPQTCVLNAVRLGARILHNSKYTDPAILDLAHKADLELVSVSQGYTRCSAIPVGHNAIITCDGGIAKTVKDIGVEVKLVSAGSVSLPGESYGFIGGATGITPDNKIIFLGDIRQHPDHVNIKLFLDEHEIGYEYIADLPLLDAGSLIFLKFP